jgi:hypothetical protein
MLDERTTIERLTRPLDFERLKCPSVNQRHQPLDSQKPVLECGAMNTVLDFY